LPVAVVMISTASAIVGRPAASLLGASAPRIWPTASSPKRPPM
jgi:hypothetical protein